MSHSTQSVGTPLPEPLIVSPAESGETQEILELLPPGIHRQLGYFGSASCILFYYDVRAEDVIWNDGRGHGIGTGGWQTLVNVIEPLAKKYHAVLIGHGSAPQALVIDRNTRSAYFIDMNQAKRVVQAQNQCKSPEDPS